MSTCPNCNGEVGDTARFCPDCGEPIDDTVKGNVTRGESSQTAVSEPTGAATNTQPREGAQRDRTKWVWLAVIAFAVLAAGVVGWPIVQHEIRDLRQAQEVRANADAAAAAAKSRAESEAAASRIDGEYVASALQMVNEGSTVLHLLTLTTLQGAGAEKPRVGAQRAATEPNLVIVTAVWRGMAWFAAVDPSSGLVRRSGTQIGAALDTPDLDTSRVQWNTTVDDNGYFLLNGFEEQSLPSSQGTRGNSNAGADELVEVPDVIGAVRSHKFSDGSNPQPMSADSDVIGDFIRDQVQPLGLDAALDWEYSPTADSQAPAAGAMVRRGTVVKVVLRIDN